MEAKNKFSIIDFWKNIGRANIDLFPEKLTDDPLLKEEAAKFLSGRRADGGWASIRWWTMPWISWSKAKMRMEWVSEDGPDQDVHTTLEALGTLCIGGRVKRVFTS